MLDAKPSTPLQKPTPYSIYGGVSGTRGWEIATVPTEHSYCELPHPHRKAPPMIWLTNLFRRPSLKATAADDLLAAQHSLLEAHKDLEWAQARIHAYEVRIERLTRYVEAP